jgi:ElaB/YqjD/DUF883 family membrane-anchored ribosome-binding protein
MSSDIQNQLDRVRDFAGDKTGAAADRLKEGSAQALERIDAARDHAADAYAKSRKAAGETYAAARDGSYRAATAANRLITEHPLATAAAAVAVGALVAALFPKGRAMFRAAPGVASAIGTKALAAAKSARDSVEHSELADTILSRAGEAASAARARVIDATSHARLALADAHIPATVKARANEAAEAALEAIERARLSERASKLASAAVGKAGDALIVAGKAINERLPSK